MIRTTILAFFLFTALPLAAAVPVSFDDTVSAYQSGDHDNARIAFRRMAETGLPEAQFNLGVMMANGQGGPVSMTGGTLWILLAAESGFQPAEDAREIVLGHLDEDQRQEVDSSIEGHKDHYGLQSLLNRHTPVACSENCRNDGRPAITVNENTEADTETENIDLVDDRFRTVNARPPEYPRDAAAKGTMGLVRLGGWLSGDGKLEHPHVISAWPGDVFENEALSQFDRWEFERLDDPGNESAEYVEQTITFTLDDLSSARDTLIELKNSIDASGSDLEAAHHAVWMVDNLVMPEIEGIDHDTIISVTHNAAQQGISRAQLDLGRRLSNGNGVEKDKEAGRFWLARAAIEGNAEAQFVLSMEDGVAEEYQRDLRRGAARAGFTPAALAEIRAQVSEPEDADPELLRNLIDNLPPRYHFSDDPIMDQAEALSED